MTGTNEVRKAILVTRTLLDAMVGDSALREATAKAADLCVASLPAAGKMMICGNGASAADAQHWAGELASLFYDDHPGHAAVAPTTNSSILTAIGNDYGHKNFFTPQVEAIGVKGDVFFALAISGNSPNVVAAQEAARAKCIATVGFTGKGSGTRRHPHSEPEHAAHPGRPRGARPGHLRDDRGRHLPGRGQVIPTETIVLTRAAA